MALTSDQQKNCLGCSDKDENIFVDDVIQKLINWLTRITCLAWVRSHENLDRVDGDPSILIGQDVYIDSKQPYGVIEITSFDVKDRKQTEKDYTGESGNAACFTITQTNTAEVSLTVFRESGESNRNQETIADDVDNYGSAPDFLLRLRAIYQNNRIRSYLTENKIDIQTFSDIQWIKQKKDNIWENQAQMNLTIQYCSTHSIPDGLLNCISLLVCDEEKKQYCKDDPINTGC